MSVYLGEECGLPRLEWKWSFGTAPIREPTILLALFVQPSRDLCSCSLIAARQGVGGRLRLSGLAQTALYRGDFALDLLETLLRFSGGLLGPL